MQSNEIMAVIRKISETASKNEKIAIIAEHGKDATFQKVLICALDPLTTYGVQKLPEPIHMVEKRQFGDQTWNIISDLSARLLTGQDALNAIAYELGALEDESAELFKRIILKDLKAGFGDSSVNKAIKGLIATFPYMRCSLPKDAKLDEWDWAAGVLSQDKADGTYTNCDHDALGEVRLSSRQGTQYPLEPFSELAAEIKATFLKETQTHGEIVVERDGVKLERQISNGIMNHVVSGGAFGFGEKPVFEVWEQIPLSEVKPKNTYKTPYKVRFGGLLAQLRNGPKSGYIKVIPTRIVKSLEEATTHFRELVQAGKEGTVMKEPNSPWKDGTSKFQVKRKIDAPCDLIVIGYEAGNGKNEKTFGSLICRTSDNLLEVYVSGFSDKLREEIHALRDTPDEWLNQIITVTFNAIMYASSDKKLHSLFLPRFTDHRLDKVEADSFPRVVEQYEAAINEV